MRPRVTGKPERKIQNKTKKQEKHQNDTSNNNAASHILTLDASGYIVITCKVKEKDFKAFFFLLSL